MRSITEEEKAFVVATWEQADRQIDTVIEDMHLFIEQPGNEINTCPALAESIHRWIDTMDFVERERIFYFPVPEACEAYFRCRAKLRVSL